MQDPIRPGRFRWRLTIAFVLTAGVAAGVLATTSFLIVRNERREAVETRSLRESRLAADLIDNTLRASTGRETMSQVLENVQDLEGFHTVLSNGDRTLSSSPQLGAEEVPRELWNAVDGSEPKLSRVELRGVPYLVVAHSLTRSGWEAYFFVSEVELSAGLSRLLTILMRDWVAVTLLAAVLGTLLSRRTLRPVAEASQAAQNLAEGLLDTRLEVEDSDEFGQWAASFNRMADALQEKIEALGEAHARERRFTSDVAHELRTPLTGLTASASMLRESLDDLPPGTRWYAEHMIRESGRLRHLVGELIEISRLDAGESIRVEHVDVETVLRSMISGRRWEDHVSTDLQPIQTQTDRRRLERILSNLIDNAVQHGASDVHVRSYPTGRGFEVEVTDAGPGIPSEHLPYIFDRFYKADPARSGGSGLGLSIAAENARLLGGTIDVVSEVGRGTTFTLRLPAVEPSPNGDDRVTAYHHS
jgi:signal transduction histidine kinase